MALVNKERAAIGGKANVAKYGASAMRERGRRGAVVTLLRHGSEFLAEARRKGHETNPLPREFFKAIASLPRPNRRKKNE